MCVDSQPIKSSRSHCPGSAPVGLACLGQFLVAAGLPPRRGPEPQGGSKGPAVAARPSGHGQRQR